MLRLPDRPFNARQLNTELAALRLPDFIGVGRFSRELDDQGHAVLEDGAIKKVPPYIVVKCDDLTASQETAATKIVADHVPIEKPPTNPRLQR